MRSRSPKMRLLGAVVLGGLLSSGASVARATAAQPEGGIRGTDARTLLVHLRRGASAASATDVARDAGAGHERYLQRLGIEVVSTTGRSAVDVAEDLRADPRVVSVEPNRMRHATGNPNDPVFFDQPQLFTSRLPAAWDVTHGSPTIDIAILDTGVDLNHPDLAGRIVPGRDVVNDDSNASDDNGHGSFVAGVAAADSDNNVGVAGSAWDARIMPVKVLGADGSGLDAGIAEGIVWAVDAGAEIINMSLGGPGFSTTLSNAVDYAMAHGVLMVAASGNEYSDVPFYPAAYDDVVAVGATDAHGDLVAFSNRGPHVDVVAQGVDVVSTMWEVSPGDADDYGIGDGTSFAAPLVSGVAALVKAKNPSFTPTQIASRLRSTAIDRGPRGIDDGYGRGLMDAYAAVGGRTAASPPQAVRDGAEPNDTALDAGAIAAEQTGTIAPEGDADWYYVDAPAPGTITISVTPPVGDGAQTLDPLIESWSPIFLAMDVFDAAGPGAPEAGSLPVDAAGRYRFRVSNAASSRSSGTLASLDPYSISSAFVAAAVSATTSEQLWVSDASPAPFAEGVAATAQPTITFARTVTEASAESSGNVRLVDGKTGGSVSATRSYDAPTKTVTVVPNAPLTAGKTYVVSVSGVADIGSDVMEETFVSRFNVAAPAPTLDLIADFNKDGYEDIVIGVPGEDVGSKVDGGVVHVLYGSTSGPTGAGSQMWHQDSSGIAGGIESGDRFGESVATGDLNRDGYDDLVVGAPYEDIGTKKDAGAFHVIFGSSSKLTSAGSQLWTQNSTGVPGVAETADRFGSSFAVGDFDNASGDDLAVGAPNEAIGSAAGAGAVHIFRGSSGGLVTSGTQLWTQDSVGISFDAEAGDGFGTPLGAGDFQGDTHDDLAIGAPSDNVVDADEGSVTVMRGSIVGLRPSGILSDDFGTNEPEAGDRFGAAVAVADVGGNASADGYADLIVGVSGQPALDAAKAGRMDVIFSDHTDPWLAVQSLDQASFDLGARETNAAFGGVLAARGFGSRGVLVAGIPLDDLPSLQDAGSVHVYQSGTSLQDGYVGLGPVGAFTQNTSGVPDTAEASDRFGSDLTLLDVDGDDEPDLAAGTPLESVNAYPGAGSAYSMRNVTSASVTSSVFNQNSAGISGWAEDGDRFGASVG